MRISDWSSDVCSSDLIVGVKAGPRDRGSQIVTENPGKQGRPDNVIGRTVDDHVLIACGGVRLLRRNEGRSDISEICSHGLCCKDRRAVGDRSGKRQRTFEPGADFLDKRSEEHTSELQSLMRLSYAVLCLIEKPQTTKLTH